VRRVTLKGLVFRRGRSVLTALAVVLGVAMISGTYVLTDTIDSAFSSIFNASYENTSAVISGREVVKESASGNATIPESLLARVRRLPHVQAAAGSLLELTSNSDSAKLLDKKGKPISPDAPTFGFGIDTSQPRFNPLKLTKGAWAGGPDQVVIDKGTAKKYGYDVGDSVGVVAQGPVTRFRITGIAKYGSVESLGGATIAVLTVPAAQKLLDKPGQLDTISLAAKPGISEEQLVREVRPLLPASAQVQTGEQRAKADAKDTETFIKFIRLFLLAFAVIALFVGGFVIFNTLSITIAQRTREFATLRTLGATRRQVLRSVLGEGLVLGVLASATGLVLGIALAKGLAAVMKALDLDLPQQGTVIATHTVVASFAVGIIVTVGASFVPALRATRIAPISAVREGAIVEPSRLAKRGGTGAVVLVAVALAALLLGSLADLATGPTLLLFGLGCLALFVGVSLVAPRIMQPLTAALGAPARRFGGSPGRLAAENANRNPARTATTAAALMIGLALVTFVATLGAGLRGSEKDSLRDQVKADYVVTSQNGFEQFSGQAAKAVPSVPGIGVVGNVLDDRARIAGDDVQVEGIDPRAFGQTYNYLWEDGSDAALANLGLDGAIVKKDFADDHDLKVGSPLRLTTPNGKHVRLVVRATYDPPAFDKIGPVLGPVSIDTRTFAANFPRPKLLYSFIKLDQGASPAATKVLKDALSRFPDAKLQTLDQWVTTQSEGINKLLNLLYVLLALSVIVSLFGMVNTLVLAVFERTREIGMLRAVGMTRRQTKRMIRHESLITALIGAGLGLPLGLLLAGLVTKALSGEGLGFSVPVESLVAFVIVAVLAGLAAAIVPARRAARLDVLGALQYE
jgi:putative ABC transport system permease protein